MAESDHRRGVTAVAIDDLVELPAAATATTSASYSHDDEEEEEGGFTFATIPRLPAGGAFPDGCAPVYPVFGRPRSSPVREDHEGLGTATTVVPLGQLLMEERGAPSGQQPADDDGGLDGVPAETYCLWAPGSQPPSPARCRKSGSTGSVLRWRQRVVGRSHSDGKEKFVFLNASSDSERNAGGGHHGWMYRGGGGSGVRKSTFLPYKQDLVGFFANASAFRRSYLPF